MNAIMNIKWIVAHKRAFLWWKVIAREILFFVFSFFLFFGTQKSRLRFIKGGQTKSKSIMICCYCRHHSHHYKYCSAVFLFWKKSINNLNSRRLLLRCVKSIEIDLFFLILWSFWSSLVVIEYADLIVNTNASNTHSANIHTIDVQSFFNLRHTNIQINNEFKNVIGIMTIVATVLSWMLIHCKWNKLKYLLK